jgi:hypothetical protein
MIQRLWAGRMKLMRPEYGYSALAVDFKEVAHTEDGQRVRRDPEEIMEGSEVYRSNDPRLAEKALEQTKKWSEIEMKLRKAYSKALSAEFEISDQSKRKAAVLAAYALAGKLRPKELFAAEFTAMAHQAAALMPAIKELIEAEGQGKRGRRSWGKAKQSTEGARDWVDRNISKIKIPTGVAGINPARVRPDMVPAAIHFLSTRNKPKWQFEGML